MNVKYGKNREVALAEADLSTLAEALDIARANRARIQNMHAKEVVHGHILTLIDEIAKRHNSDVPNINQYRRT